MNDVTIIDQFLNTFATYIDSGFGLLRGEVAFLTATLIVIDMTIAGLYWAMSHATGQGEDVIAKLLRKGALRRCLRLHPQQLQLAGQHRVPLVCGIGHHRHRLGHHDGELLAAGPACQDRHRRRSADSGTDRRDGGLPEVFANLDPIVVMFLAWLVVVLCFFVLAISFSSR
ncbi:conjugal transfer protein TrbL [Salmonella enterica subsp. enterica]|uniref:Conjugal transfer protein TrbL n=1 Tax=Salmonella enterica I TaxID=59201 RepID=A0A379W326_SALET|nr:conjugal transfer protein TrbL [Salmonella enterica subsp. enterica]